MASSRCAHLITQPDHPPEAVPDGHGGGDGPGATATSTLTRYVVEVDDGPKNRNRGDEAMIELREYLRLLDEHDPSRPAGRDPTRRRRRESGPFATIALCRLAWGLLVPFNFYSVIHGHTHAGIYVPAERLPSEDENGPTVVHLGVPTLYKGKGAPNSSSLLWVPGSAPQAYKS